METTCHYLMAYLPSGWTTTPCGLQIRVGSEGVTKRPNLVNCKNCSEALNASPETFTDSLGCEFFRGCESLQHLNQQLREVDEITRRTERRLQEEALHIKREPPAYREPARYNEEQSVASRGVIDEAWARYHAWNFDYDEWAEELLLRGKGPDKSSFWVFQANINAGLWSF